MQLGQRDHRDRGCVGQRTKGAVALLGDEDRRVEQAALISRRGLGHSSSSVASVSVATSRSKSGSSGARASRRVMSARETKVRRSSRVGTRSATGRPSTVIRSRSPASTWRSTRPTLLSSSRCGIVFTPPSYQMYYRYASGQEPCCSCARTIGVYRYAPQRFTLL